MSHHGGVTVAATAIASSRSPGSGTSTTRSKHHGGTTLSSYDGDPEEENPADWGLDDSEGEEGVDFKKRSVEREGASVEGSICISVELDSFR